ncbi:hypothetical protein [Pedobacter sp. SYSU D00535]|uniref:hypothetical protein n=1 Tax=Pedobacter sp. SYSU D00535 TaxID=2810308 RepID=UPI001A975FCF|nr:hypothetical protein [Pedobacter sp. SYSU D00535]
MRRIKVGIGVVLMSVLLMFTCEEFSWVSGTAASASALVKSDENRLACYADSVDAILPHLSLQKSLIYQQGNYSFQVFKYMTNGEPVLYIERGSNGREGQVEKKYYVKDNRLALYEENAVTNNSTKPYVATKAYFKNNRLFYAEQKVALSDSGLQRVRFQKANLPATFNVPNLSTYEDALTQRGNFDLVFEGIAESPKAKYIILGKSGYKGYRAPIRVANEDAFIHELSTNAYEYRGEKLEIDWEIGDTNEVLYESGRLSRN